MAQRLLPEYLDSKQETPEVKIAGLADLENRIDSLERDMARLRLQMGALSQESLRTIARLLSPLYKSLKPIFGELDAAELDDGPQVDDRKRKVWESWKSKLPAQAKVIDALLLHGEMNTQQLAIAVGLHRTTIPAHIYKLNQAGLINKSGGKFSLKEI